MKIPHLLTKRAGMNFRG